MFKKKDLILIAVILLIAGLGLIAVRYFQRDTGAVMTAYIDGEEYDSYSLDEDQVVEINEWGYNRFVIKDGYVYMEEADCPDQYCVKHAKIHLKNETIICLPHYLVLEITEGEVGDVDIVTQ